MELTVTVMTFVIFIITLAVWAVVGLVFWIPILTRATTVFSGMILYATLTHQKADAVREYLRVASGFYANGFRITREALYPPKENESPSEIEFHAGRFTLELLWTVAFWLVALWIGKPHLIEPLTSRIWNSAQLLASSLDLLIVTIIVGVILLCMLGTYLWFRYHELLRENRRERPYPSVILDKKNSDQSQNIQRQLDRILRFVQELSLEFRVFTSASTRVADNPPSPSPPTSEKRRS